MRVNQPKLMTINYRFNFCTQFPTFLGHFVYVYIFARVYSTLRVRVLNIHTTPCARIKNTGTTGELGTEL